MFYEALLANRVSEKQAKLMYAAVYLKGPRWTDQAVENNNIINTELLPDLKDFNKELLASVHDKYHVRNQMRLGDPIENELAYNIEHKDMSLEEIDVYAEQIRAVEMPYMLPRDWLSKQAPRERERLESHYSYFIGR